MPTLLDNTLKSKNMVLAFGGVVAAATAWMLAGDLFPADPDPKGDPETWTREQMRRWLEARNLFPQPSDTREQLLARIQANLKTSSQVADRRVNLVDLGQVISDLCINPPAVVHFVKTPEAGVKDLPLVLKGIPPETAASSVGTGNIADGAKAVILGGGYDDNDYEVMRKAVDAAALERRPVWLRNDLSVAMPPPGPEYGKAVVVRVKDLLSKLEKENSLDAADSNMYWF
ncbi:hypothetical protein MY10362_003537 [Beauveria mimosiformis]